MKKKLYIIPSFLGEDSPLDVMPNQVVEFLKYNSYFIVEKEKTFRKFIKDILPDRNQSELIVFEINKHLENTLTKELIDFILDNIEDNCIGLVSEAGTPCIADPGSNIVKFCHINGIVPVPLVGPSSILLSLMASGLNGENFAFNGYLPIDKKERKNKILELEKKVLKESQTQIFIETPYRNESIFLDIINLCNPNINFCLAIDITLKTENITTNKIKNWRNIKPDFFKKPTIFLIGI